MHSPDLNFIQKVPTLYKSNAMKIEIEDIEIRVRLLAEQRPQYESENKKPGPKGPEETVTFESLRNRIISLEKLQRKKTFRLGGETSKTIQK